jgi:ribose-phosphate pyrophosphokinase
MIIFAGENSQELAKKIARKKKAQYSELKIGSFPDGELYLRFMKPIKGKQIAIVQTFYPDPNKALMNSYFAIKTAKELGAKKVTLIAPYLGFMRQDKRFHDGECQSNKIMAGLLNIADEVVTLDPHLHRIKSMREIFKTKTVKLSANKLIEEYIKKNYKDPWIIGPDSESYQWARIIAEHINAHATILRKKRYTSTKVKILVKDKGFKGKDVVIVDDIISTGHTMIEPIKQLKRKGAKSVTCICIHGLFVQDALKKLRKLGVKVVSTNTVQNPVSKIDISGLISSTL